jgi:hypothetical protein
VGAAIPRWRGGRGADVRPASADRAGGLCAGRTALYLYADCADRNLLLVLPILGMHFDERSRQKEEEEARSLVNEEVRRRSSSQDNNNRRQSTQWRPRHLLATAALLFAAATRTDLPRARAAGQTATGQTTTPGKLRLGKLMT